MAKDLYSKQLAKFLDETVGDHAKIAKKAGVAQATISRIHLRKCSPRLEIAEALLTVFWAQQKRKAKGLAPQYPTKAVNRRWRTAASASLSQ